MGSGRGLVAALGAFIHRRFLWLLLASYAAAALWPAPGLWLRDTSLGDFDLAGWHVQVSLSLALLGFLLFNAGLGVRADRLRGLLRRPGLLLAGLAANLLVPVAFIFLVARASGLWHNPDEVQNVLVGLALVASMPVAGSSAAWSQRAGGDLALSLGLVLGSTLCSPLTTPLALHAVGLMASGPYAGALHRLAEGGAGGFLAVGVVLPCLLGLLGRRAAGPERLERAGPSLRLAAALVLLLLNYANAAVSLPQAVADPDWDFLAAILLVTGGLCLLAFAAGWWLARLLGADAGQRAALTFGLGMNNNGTGLVLAATALAAHPRVLLPVIFYNLVQHLAAAAVDQRLSAGPGHPVQWPMPAASHRPRARAGRSSNGLAKTRAAPRASRSASEDGPA
jgi:BASS family bile acid:Na+ symporter